MNITYTMGKEIACVLTFERIPMTSRDIRFGGQLADLISIISASCRTEIR